MMIEKPAKNLNAIDRQWLGIAVLSQLAGVDTIDLGLRNAATGSFQNFSGLGVCALELEQALAACRSRNLTNCDVYIRPARGAPAAIVMLDDLPLEVCQIAGDGLNHMIVETSPQNHQLWLGTDRALSESDRKTVQCDLIRRHGGDPGSGSGEHYGRLPGFRNRKPKYRARAPWVNLIHYSLDDAPLAVDGLLNAGLDSRPPRGGCVLEPAAGVACTLPKQQVQVGTGDSVESHREFKFACVSLSKNVSTEIIIQKIAARALSRGKRKTLAAAEIYARKTVAAAALRI